MQAARMIKFSPLLSKACPPRLSLMRCMGRWNNRSVAPYMREMNRRRAVVELDHMLKDGYVPIPRRSSFSDWNYQAELAALQARLGETFNQELLTRAFVLDSHVKLELKKQEELGVEISTGLIDNSELANKGVAIINEALTHWLRSALPFLPEEGINAILQYLTSENMIADIAFHIGLRELVLSEEYPPSARSLNLTLQALVGALHATDPERADRFVTDIIGSQIAGKDINEIWSINNPMAVLIDILTRSGMPAPESRLLWQTGPATILANHTVGIYCNKEIIGQSNGETVDIAEEMAARDALRNIFDIKEASYPLPFGQDVAQSGNPNQYLNNYSVNPANIIHC